MFVTIYRVLVWYCLEKQLFEWCSTSQPSDDRAESQSLLDTTSLCAYLLRTKNLMYSFSHEQQQILKT